jgi:hypothetical protein
MRGGCCLHNIMVVIFIIIADDPTGECYRILVMVDHIGLTTERLKLFVSRCQGKSCDIVLPSQIDVEFV